MKKSTLLKKPIFVVAQGSPPFIFYEYIGNVIDILTQCSKRVITSEGAMFEN